jgi:hypothetical protein
MKRDSGSTQLSAVFVDYDNIYLSLRRKNEDAAKRFSKDAAVWLRALEKGRIIRSDGGMTPDAPRRIVLNRCYGNPVPRRNPSDNTTDMNSFPFVRHHFLRAGFEIVDCPPLTSQQKNAADIRMVMDLRDYLTHDTYFDEFIILSGDADFTPVLHRLRQHARRTVIFSNDHTAAAYSAICDGEVREADLIQALIGGGQALVEATTVPVQAQVQPQVQVQPQIQTQMQPQSSAVALQAAVQAPRPAEPAPRAAPAAQLRLEDLRVMIITEVVAGIRSASGPVPLEALADRAIRTLGHERTVGTAWAGAGSFRELIRIGLPADLRMTEQPPFLAYDPARHIAAAQPASTLLLPAQPTPPSLAQQREALAAAMIDLTQSDAEVPVAPPSNADQRASRYAPLRPSAGPAPRAPQPLEQPRAEPLAYEQLMAPPVALAPRSAMQDPVMHRGSSTRTPPPTAPSPVRPDAASSAQSAMARIQDAAQAPALSAADYRVVFTAMAQEINDNGLTGAQTLAAIAERADGQGVPLRKEDIRFVLDVVSESDPWFEQGATPTLFAGRFRNFVVARCRDHGLQLSAKDLDLIDAWIMGVAAPARGFGAGRPAAQELPASQQPSVQAPGMPARDASGNRWWAQGDAPQREPEDDFPRIVRTRQRG